MSYYTYYLYKYILSTRQKISDPESELKSKCSKLLKSNSVKDIIIKSLLGPNVSKSRYPSYDNGSSADAIFDIIYIPSNNNISEPLPPIAVVIQETINKSVMADLVFYSTTLYQQYKMLPIMLIISMKGYACDKMKAEFGSKKNDISCLEKSTSCLLWAQHFYVLSWESIESFIDITPMDKLVTLIYCIINTEDILKNHQDATIKLLLKLL